jgi:ribosomal protein S18 acetylase RimI-like enzyme
MSGVLVRPYVPADRERVRRICFLTGYMGEPVSWLWRDEESFADMFSGYYTDVEPESALVAEVDGVVGGYLLGCLDSRRAWDPLKVAVRHVIRRQIAFRPGTAGVVWRAFAEGAWWQLTGQPLPKPFLDERFLAHLHIDLLPFARGRGVGAKLMRSWFAILESRGVRGCHLETLAENDRAIAFFHAMGFERYGSPVPIPGWRSPAGKPHHTQVMVRALAEPGEGS